MDKLQMLALAMGSSWASGINAYAVAFGLGVMGRLGYVELPVELEWLEGNLMLAATGFLYLAEFFADKIPLFDSLWDSVHTFVRIPAGAMLAGGAVESMGPEWQAVAMAMGGTLAAGTHLTKAGGRALINTSPEPVTNWTASVTEDAVAVGTVWAIFAHPWVVVAGVVVSVALMIWLLPKLWRGVKAVFRGIGRLFGGQPPPAPAGQAASSRKEGD